MLTIIVQDTETWDPNKEEFIVIKGGTLKLEHSLRAIREWEAHYKKPFLSKQKRTEEETLFYLKCMTYNKEEVDENIYYGITNSQSKEISNYINDERSATIINKKNRGRSGVVTAEEMYSWLVLEQIPFEVQDWHLSQLLKLVDVVNIKNNPKKMKKNDIRSEYDAINEARKAKYGTHG